MTRAVVFRLGLARARRDRSASINGSTLQFPFQNFAGERRVRLALAQFHHLAFEEIQRGSLAGLEIGSRAGIGGDGFVAEFFNRAGVADLREAFFLNNRAGDLPVSNISANTCCAAELLMVLASTKLTSSRIASGLNFKSASVNVGQASRLSLTFLQWRQARRLSYAHLPRPVSPGDC